MKTEETLMSKRRARMAAAHPVLQGAFRPFFLGGSFWAVSALGIWLLMLAGALVSPSHFEPLAWHRHEMLFGFVGAVVAGFLLTAIPNWTARQPIAGTPLALLFGVWVAARMAVLFSASLDHRLGALLDVGFYLLLAGIAAREILAARNRNVPVVVLVLLFAGADALDHAGAAGLVAEGLGSRSGIALVVLMISLIGGRIVPAFTRNWMQKQAVPGRLPSEPGRFDLVTIGVTAFALLAWMIAPADPRAGVVMLVAGGLQAIRVVRWGGWRTGRDPLVLILHVGYAWMPVGLVLLGAGLVGALVPPSAAIHALTAGAMATMILAVMTRATLGHTGRPLVANPATVALYLLVTVGAVARVVVPLGVADYTLGMEAAALLWGGAFLTFLLVYGPILTGPRANAS